MWQMMVLGHFRRLNLQPNQGMARVNNSGFAQSFGWEIGEGHLPVAGSGRYTRSTHQRFDSVCAEGRKGDVRSGHRQRRVLS